MGLPQAQEVTSGVAKWLSGRKEVIGPVAGVLLFLGVLTKVGGGRGRDSIPGPWRGAPTALIALAVIWDRTPEALPQVLVQLGVALVAAYVLSRFARTEVNARSWLASTFVNLLGSALFVLIRVDDRTNHAQGSTKVAPSESGEPGRNAAGSSSENISKNRR